MNVGGRARSARRRDTAGARGLTVASLILTVASWPWLFLVNLPIGLVAVPVFLLIARPGQPHARPFDLSGALLSAVALGLLVVGVDTLGSGDLGPPPAEIAIGLPTIALPACHHN